MFTQQSISGTGGIDETDYTLKVRKESRMFTRFSRLSKLIESSIRLYGPVYSYKTNDYQCLNSVSWGTGYTELF